MILVVEDNETMRELMKKFLLNEGYRVISACDGVEAVQEYEKHGRNIRLVITDIEMPKLDGVAAYRQIKKMNPEVKVIFVSGSLDKHVQRQLQSEGVCHFFNKPYLPAEILARVCDILGGS